MQLKFSIIIATVGGISLGGCMETNSGNANLGAAVRHNMALQIIDPNPTYKGDAVPGGNGARTAVAQERYQTDKVEKPERLRTSDVSGDDGDSGGSGGKK